MLLVNFADAFRRQVWFEGLSRAGLYWMAQGGKGPCQCSFGRKVKDAGPVRVLAEPAALGVSRAASSWCDQQIVASIVRRRLSIDPNLKGLCLRSIYALMYYLRSWIAFLIGIELGLFLCGSRQTDTCISWGHHGSYSLDLATRLILLWRNVLNLRRVVMNNNVEYTWRWQQYFPEALVTEAEPRRAR